MQATAAFKSGDPLTFTLLIAIAVHILLFFGLSFQAPHVRLPHVMEVTLALHRSDKENPHADYLAQANQQGSGSADDARLITSPHQSPFKSDAINQIQPEQQSAQSPQVDQARRQVIVTSANSPFAHDNSLSQDVQLQQAQARQAQVATQESQEIATLEARLAQKENDYAKRKKVNTLTSVSTRADRDAAYMDAFRARVEQIGNRNYPEQARSRHMQGNVRLLVALNSNGTVKQLTVLKSSGYPLLDEAAKRSVNMAAPFPPFPMEIRRDTDVLQIIRTWKFTETLETDES
jgi:protein TonB